MQVVDHLQTEDQQRHLQFLVRSLLQEVEDTANLEDQEAELTEHLDKELETQVDSLHQKETQEETPRVDVRLEQAAEAELGEIRFITEVVILMAEEV